MPDQPLAVGDPVIYLPADHGPPVMDKVSGVTPSGMVAIFTKPGVRFKRDRYGTGYKSVAGQPRYNKDVVLPYTNALWEQRGKEYEDRRRDKQEKQDRRAKERAERDREQREQLAEVQSLFTLDAMTAYREALPDGSRFYVLRVPVQEEYMKHKGGWERAAVLLWDEKDVDWQTGKESTTITLHMASYNGQHGGGVSSCHRWREFPSDEAALWEVVRVLYFHW